MGQIIEIDEDVLRAASRRLRQASNYYASPGPSNECRKLADQLLAPIRKGLFVGKRFSIMWRSTTEPDRGQVISIGSANVAVRFDVADDKYVEGYAVIPKATFDS